ncbi:MAG TPA: PQQ-dependent sugar dehydrogenase, partial [Gemmatales bacterium]|nr:PQQ-dependent sugar dehydrogenase [Gemmatales bacterium]
SGGGAAEIWATGLRNPFRNSFDRANGNFYIADVGQGAREEINFQASGLAGGRNYGWRPREGRIATPGIGEPTPAGAIDPIYDYDHGIGQSVTGGYVYRGTNYLDGGVPLDGTYFFADFIQQKIFSFRYTGTDIATNAATDRTSQLRTSTNGFTINGISSFGEDLAGNLYVVDYGGGSANAGEIFLIRGVAVPEPASLAMIGLAACGGIGYFRFRRSSKRDVVIE